MVRHDLESKKQILSEKHQILKLVFEDIFFWICVKFSFVVAHR